MTIRQAINKANKIEPNTEFTESELIEWLDKCDRQIKQEIIDIRKDADLVEFDGYDDDTDENTELLVKSPYDELYIFFIKAQLNMYDGSTNKYNIAMQIYNDKLSQFRNWYNRQHSAPNVPLKF